MGLWIAHVAVFLQPLQLFADFDFSVPGVFVEGVAFSGKNQERTRDAEVMQGVVEQVVFSDRDANVVSASDDVGWCFHFTDLEDGGFVVVARRLRPGESAEEVGIVKGGVVVAPVGDVLDRSGACDSGFEACGLGDEPVGHVSAVAVAADGEVFGIGNAAFTSASTPSRMSLPERDTISGTMPMRNLSP